MKKWLLMVLTTVVCAGTAFTQTYDFWMWNGWGAAPTAVSPKGIPGISSATVSATATGSAGFLYRNTDWSQKWGAAVPINTVTVLNEYGAGDGSASITAGMFYTLNVPTLPVADNTSNVIGILETSAEPVTISSVTRDFLQPIPEEPVEVTITLSGTPSAEEKFYVIYTNNNWSSATAVSVTMSGTTGTATLPPQPEGTDVSYYAMSSTVLSTGWGSSRDYFTLRLNNNAGTNYNYTSSNTADTTPPTTVTDLDATADANLNKITLTWTPVTEENFDTYEIFYSTTGIPTVSDSKFDKNDYIALGTISTSTVTLTGLEWGTEYFFSIRGVDAAGNKGTLSTPDKATTVAEPYILMDGTFDGEEKWGAPVAIASNTTDGWGGANATDLYVKYHDGYIYLGANLAIEGWQRWVFIINTVSGGASQDSWGLGVYYDHTDKPDFSIRKGNSAATAQFNAWNGSAWTYDDGTLTEDIWYKQGASFVEVRVSQAMLNGAENGDVQFYITGNNAEHGAFDCLPDDDNSTGWSAPEVTSNLSFYASGLTLPVELASFTGSRQGDRVRLNWSTRSESNNAGFEVEEKLAGQSWTSVGFVAGKGTTQSGQHYSFEVVSAQKASYRLKQVDLDGSFSYSAVVEVTGAPVSFLTARNYPNPFNPVSTIEISVPAAGTVNLEVFNTLGQRVFSQLLADMQPGLHSVPFNGAGLSSGLYQYRILHNGHTVTGTMSLIK